MRTTMLLLALALSAAVPLVHMELFVPCPVPVRTPPPPPPALVTLAPPQTATNPSAGNTSAPNGPPFPGGFGATHKRRSSTPADTCPFVALNSPTAIPSAPRWSVSGRKHVVTFDSDSEFTDFRNVETQCAKCRPTALLDTLAGRRLVFTCPRCLEIADETGEVYSWRLGKDEEAVRLVMDVLPSRQDANSHVYDVIGATASTSFRMMVTVKKSGEATVDSTREPLTEDISASLFEAREAHALAGGIYGISAEGTVFCVNAAPELESLCAAGDPVPEGALFNTEELAKIYKKLMKEVEGLEIFRPLRWYGLLVMAVCSALAMAFGVAIVVLTSVQGTSYPTYIRYAAKDRGADS